VGDVLRQDNGWVYWSDLATTLSCSAQQLAPLIEQMVRRLTIRPQPFGVQMADGYQDTAMVTLNTKVGCVQSAAAQVPEVEIVDVPARMARTSQAE
jgi:hypothetical protein